MKTTKYSASLKVHEMAQAIFLERIKSVIILNEDGINLAKGNAYRIAYAFYNEEVCVIEGQ